MLRSPDKYLVGDGVDLKGRFQKMEKMLICQFYADIGPDQCWDQAGTWFAVQGIRQPPLRARAIPPAPDTSSIPSDVGFVWSVVIKIVSITLCWFRAFIQADCRLPTLPLASWISALWQLNFHSFFFTLVRISFFIFLVERSAQCVFDQKAISIFFISHRKVGFVVLQIAMARPAVKKLWSNNTATFF